MNIRFVYKEMLLQVPRFLFCFLFYKFGSTLLCTLPVFSYQIILNHELRPYVIMNKIQKKLKILFVCVYFRT